MEPVLLVRWNIMMVLGGSLMTLAVRPGYNFMNRAANAMSNDTAGYSRKHTIILPSITQITTQ